MQTVISFRVSQEEQEKEMQRRMAIIQSGYAFIVLQLMEKKKRRVSGIDVLKPIPTEDGMKLDFEIVQRQLEFAPDPSRGGIWSAYVLVTDTNKDFLASHLDEGYWEIVSVISGRKGKTLILEEILEELAELKQELIKKAIDLPADMPRLLPTDTKRYDIANIDEDVLRKELERRDAEKNREIDVKGALPKKAEKTEAEKLSETIPEEPEKEPKKRGRRKAPIVESAKAPDIVDDSKENPIQDSGTPDSEFVTTGPIGVVQP